jgi:Caspase domain
VQPVAQTGRSQILKALGAACRQTKGVETLLLYFSGHGLHYNGRDYLIPGDADVGDPKLLEDLLVSTDLSRFLDDCNAQLILLVVDACREGVKLEGKAIGLTSWGRGEIRKAANRQFAVIFSCDSGQYSRFVPGEDGFSLFTAALAEVLEPGHVAQTLGEVVSATENRLQELCREHGKQTQTVKLACEDDGVGTLRNSVICGSVAKNSQQRSSSDRSEKELKSQSESSYKPFLGVDQDRSYDRRTVQSHSIDELDQNLIRSFLDQPEARTQLSSQGMLLSSVQDKLNLLGLARGINPVVGAFLCFSPVKFLIEKTASCSLHINVFSGIDNSPDRI